MPKRLTVEPTTTTRILVETIVLPDSIYAEAEAQAQGQGYADLNACLKAYIKLLVRVRREGQARQVDTSDLEAL